MIIIMDFMHLGKKYVLLFKEYAHSVNYVLGYSTRFSLVIHFIDLNQHLGVLS